MNLVAKCSFQVQFEPPSPWPFAITAGRPMAHEQPDLNLPIETAMSCSPIPRKSAVSTGPKRKVG